MICRRRVTSSPSARACASGMGRAGGRTCSAKRAMISASSASVLASRPVARAKSRICRGLTTAKGRPAAAIAAATVTSNPPVASSTTSSSGTRPSRSARAAKPSPSRGTAKASPDGRRCTSRRSFETSMPTKYFSISTRPCQCGLAARPKRLFGFDGTTDGAPGSVTASCGRGTIGLPSVTALPSLRRDGNRDIQGTEYTEVLHRRPGEGRDPPGRGTSAW